MTSSQTNYRSLYEPESNISTLDGNLSVELPFQRKQDYVLYNTGNADLANISVPEGKRMTSVHNGEVNHDEPVNPSIYSQNCRSMHQATDDTDSFDHTSSLHSYEEQLRLQSIQRQGTMESYRRGIVLPGSELLLRQPHDSLPNLSLTNEPQGSLPNLSLENHNSLASQYPSHIHQSTSQYQSHKVVLPNHSGMSGEVSHNAYQHQAGRPNIHIGVSQCTSQGQAAKVVFPNRSAMLGEANHNAYQNQASSSNIGVNQYFSQDQYSKVVLPNRSAVLGEINQNLPLDIQHQSNIALTGREPTSVDQTTPLGYNNSFKSNRTGMKEPQPASLISQRNQKLDKQHPYNNTIPPVFQHMPSSNISLFMDKGGTEEFQGNQGQYGSSNQTSSLNQSGVPPNQSVAQSNHHGLPNFVANQQPSAPIGYQVPPSQNHPRIEKSNYMQHSDSGYTGKKVFILHFAQAVDDNPVLKLGVTLRRMKVDVTLDFFEYDNPPDSWPLWYERKIKDSDVVLCIITENFYHQLTSGNHVLGYSVYNLMNSSQNIAFRAVFIDARKEMEYVPPAMRGATCYSISSDRLTPNDDEFANLYAFLTGQNRVKKPELGNMVILAPKRSRCKSHNFIIVLLILFSVLF